MLNNTNDDRGFPIARFESMLKTNDVFFFDTQEFEMIASHYLEIGKIALAYKAVKIGLEQHPTASKLSLLKIELFIFEDKLDQAENLVDELEKSEPYNDELFIQKANILSKRNAHKKAITTLENILEIDQNHIEVYSLIAMEFLFLDDYESAKYYFLRCFELDNEDYAALYNIMFCFDMLGQRKEAIQYLNLLLDKNPYCEIAWHQLGLQYAKNRDFDKALGAFEFAIIADEGFLGAYMEKGKILEHLDRYKEAIANYQITLDLHDPTAFAYLRIGKCFEALNVEKAAVDYYQKSIDEDPLLDKGWIALAEYHIAKKQHQKAQELIDRALTMDEENPIYWKLAGVNHHRKLNFQKAEQALAKSIDFGNYELETWTMRIDILVRFGQIVKAGQCIEQAEEFYMDEVEILYRLSGIYFLLNKPTLAYRKLHQALEIDAEFAIILEELFPDVFNRPSIQKIIKSYTPS